MGRPVSHVFVGRQAELGRLEAALQAAAGGRPSVVLLAGEAGVGKTRLLQALASHVGDEATFLYGRCLPVADGELPFAPFVDALRASSGSMAGGEVGASASGAGSRGPGPSPHEPSPDPAAWIGPGAGRSLAVAGWATQAHVFELVLEELRRLASGGPTALVTEDLHWADRSSRELLLFLARSLATERVLMLATYRSDELHRRHPLLGTLAELGRLPTVERLELPPLTAEETAEVVRSLAPGEIDRTTVDQIVGRSEGIPFHAEELLAATLSGRTQGLTPSLADTLTVRLAALPPEALHLVRTASAIGRRADHRLLATVARLDESEVLEAARVAVEGHIFDVVDGGDESPIGYEFHHALLAEAAYGELLPAERVAVHAAIAAALEGQPPGASGSGAVRAAELAYHWERALVPDKELAAAVAAGLAADAARASAEALGQYRRALGLWTRAEDPARLAGMDEAALLGLAADAANGAGDAVAAVRLAETALERLPSDAPAARRVAILEALYLGHWEAGRPAEARAALQEALVLVPADTEPGLRARILSFMGWVAFLEDRFDDARAASEEAVALARGTGDAAVERLALYSLGSVLLHVGEVARSEAILRRVAAEGAPAETAVIRARTRLGDLLIEAGRLGEAAATYRAVIEDVRALGRWGGLGEILTAVFASALVPAGEWREASARLDEAIDDRASRVSIWPLFYRTWLRVGQGDVAGARADLAAAEPLIGTTHNARSAAGLMRAFVAHAEGRFEAARAAIDSILELNPDVRYDTMPLAAALGMEVEADLAVVAAARRDEPAVEAARRRGAVLADLMARILDASGERAQLPTLRGLAARVAAERTRLDGRADPAAFESAAERLDLAGRRYEAACCRYRLAEALLDSGAPRGAARVALRSAWQTASELGAAGLATAVRSLADRSRLEVADAPSETAAEPARVALPGDPYGLTPREASVLALLAGGLTNREIGERLFIAESTAGVHVSNVMGKLGVQGRAGAAALGVRLGLVPEEGGNRSLAGPGASAASRPSPGAERSGRQR